MMGPLSVLHHLVCRVAICVAVTNTTQAATVNNLSIKHAPHRGGDLPSVDLATVRRNVDLIQAVTSRQACAVAGYVLLHELSH